MSRRSGTFTMFYGPQVRELLEEKKRELQRAIDLISENEILNANEMEYVDNLAQKYATENPVIDFDKVFTSRYERLIPSEQFPPDIFTKPGKRQERFVRVV